MFNYSVQQVFISEFLKCYAMQIHQDSSYPDIFSSENIVQQTLKWYDQLKQELLQQHLRGGRTAREHRLK